MKIYDLFNIKNKKFLITGALGLIGKPICKFLLDNDAIVIAVDRKEESLKELAEGDENIIIFKTNIDNESEIISLWEMLKKKFKKIDVLVNMAAKSTSNTFERLETIEWDEIMATNLRGTFLMCKAAVNSGLLKRGSSIINISSIYGIVSPDQRIYGDTRLNSSLVYGSSKAGVIQLTKYLATYLADRRIRVNCISPGGIFNKQPKYFLERYIKKTPLERMGSVDDIIGAIVYLSSEKASAYVTGGNIIIDGGFTIW